MVNSDVVLKTSYIPEWWINGFMGYDYDRDIRRTAKTND